MHRSTSDCSKSSLVCDEFSLIWANVTSLTVLFFGLCAECSRASRKGKKMEPRPEPLLASDLVEELKKLIEAHGDLPVTFDDDGRFVRGVQAHGLNDEQMDDETLSIFILGW